MADYTKGTWKSDLEDASKGDDIIITVNDSFPVATVLGSDSFPCSDFENSNQLDKEARANAQLISAAPDLFEACLRFNNWFGEPFDSLSEQWKQIDQIREMVRAALAKATGGEI